MEEKASKGGPAVKNHLVPSMTNPSSIPGTHTAGGENSYSLSSDLHTDVCHEGCVLARVPTHTYTDTHNRQNVDIVLKDLKVERGP